MCSGRFNGGGGRRAVLTSEFFNKAPFPRIKHMHVLVCICDKWRRDVFRSPPSKFQDPSLVVRCTKDVVVDDVTVSDNCKVILMALDATQKQRPLCTHVLYRLKPKFHLARHITTRHSVYRMNFGTEKAMTCCIALVWQHGATARQARPARHDTRDTSCVSCRDVTQQVEFGLKRQACLL